MSNGTTAAASRHRSNTNHSNTSEPRALSTIAWEIKRDWVNMSPHARPYVNAMMSLDTVRDMFYADSAQSVVLYFLSNASTWRGPVAKAVKAELKVMLKANGYSW